MIKKAIIPAAGYGTRSLPISKVVPKELFPIGNRPAIDYIVEEAIQSGIEEILIIVSRSKNLIFDYFDRSIELETVLKQKQKEHLLDKIKVPDVHIQYIRQPFASGLGDAIRLGKKFIHNEAFAVLLPDEIILNQMKPALKQLIEVYKNYKKSVLGLYEVKKDQLSNYGVVKPIKVEHELFKVAHIVEKPTHHPPSNLAVIGRYIFTPQIFSYLEEISSGVDGEIQLTDAINELRKTETCFGKLITAKRFDIGRKEEYLKAITYLNDIEE
ncbi:UTP--glucose-1-phosphate uridylyltransferase [Chengkuizengella axinellae]|uniref:UTP--glucose-1-phosphate uridylyltransferase n=1 Tax=Chengkuizengella axinellae TaxID=3064388 RepID=A0ABT9J469_9BACL|nr:UTP--glucose-1-phosphate uridylyltransferase [Chengkuizengella sp. 2205SS18-9]MDP5276417.1 UTP--glucose-1-phosphate uridylyltransferase [Chengkuizengella sp. 2205SS18-9]